MADGPGLNWIVLTDEPEEFADLPVMAVGHQPTGPMAVDFLTRLPPTGDGRGQPAYHDKRFVVELGLKKFDTAIFVDADTRITSSFRLPAFRPGIAADKTMRASIADHLRTYGPHRLLAYEQLAEYLTGSAETIRSAQWCNEALFAVTKDGNEAKFMDAWARGADFMKGKDVLTGEGGVIGIAAAYAGWSVDYNSMTKIAASMHHEGHGPKTK